MVDWPAIPRQSGEARANVSSETHTGTGAEGEVYVSHMSPEVQSLLVLHWSPVFARGWHTPLAQRSVPTHGIDAPHACPVVAAGTHFEVPVVGWQKSVLGHWSPGSAQKSPSFFDVGVAQAPPMRLGAVAQMSPLCVQSALL
jgi:hypothetical protein